MPRGTPLDDDELNDILSIFEESLRKGFQPASCYKYVAMRLGRSPGVIKNALGRIRSTTKLAEAKLRAGSSQMVDRLMAEADASQLMNILSRPNIGVLEPAAKEGGNGFNGFKIAVQADTCGAVQIGVQVGGGGQLAPSSERSEALGEAKGLAGEPTLLQLEAEVDAYVANLAAYADDVVDAEVIGGTDGGTNHTDEDRGRDGGRQPGAHAREESALKAVIAGARARIRAAHAQADGLRQDPRQDDAQSGRPTAGKGRRTRPERYSHQADQRLQVVDVQPQTRPPRLKKKRPDSDYAVHLSYHHESFDQNPDQPPDWE